MYTVDYIFATLNLWNNRWHQKKLTLVNTCVSLAVSLHGD